MIAWLIAAVVVSAVILALGLCKAAGRDDQRRIHVVPDPESDGWLTLHITDQEAFEWDRQHYGESVAVANWEELHRDDSLKVVPGAEG